MTGRLLHWLRFPGLVRAIEYRDPETGEVVLSVKTSPRYTTILVGGREFYFLRESGKFDGVGAMSLDDALPANRLLAEKIRRSRPAHAASARPR